MRSVLTTLGIIIGIVTVTLMGTAIDGLNTAFHNSISGIGADVLYVDRIGLDDQILMRSGWRSKSAQRSRATRSSSLRRQMPMAQNVAPYIMNSFGISYRSKDSSGVDVIGTTDQFMAIQRL